MGKTLWARNEFQVAGGNLINRCKHWLIPFLTSLKTRLSSSRGFYFIKIWCRGQAVRQRSAKPSFPSSNLGGTSSKKSTAFAVLFLQLSLPLRASEVAYGSEVRCASEVSAEVRGKLNFTLCDSTKLHYGNSHNFTSSNSEILHIKHTNLRVCIKVE